MEEWRFYVDEKYSIPGAHILVLLSRSLLLRGVAFAAMTKGPLRVCCDATHDIGVQKFKMLALGFLGVHFAGLPWGASGACRKLGKCCPHLTS